jgi:hypothetical protein
VETAIINATKKVKLNKKYESHCLRWLCLRKHQRDFYTAYALDRPKLPPDTPEIDLINEVLKKRPDIFFLQPETYRDFINVCPGEGIFPTP